MIEKRIIDSTLVVEDFLCGVMGLLLDFLIIAFVIAFGLRRKWERKDQQGSPSRPINP